VFHIRGSSCPVIHHNLCPNVSRPVITSRKYLAVRLILPSFPNIISYGTRIRSKSLNEQRQFTIRENTHNFAMHEYRVFQCVCHFSVCAEMPNFISNCHTRYNPYSVTYLRERTKTHLYLRIHPDDSCQ